EPAVRRPARKPPHPYVRVDQPRAVPVRDLLPGLSRRGGPCRRADLVRGGGAVLRCALARQRHDRPAHRRLHLRGDRERAVDGARADAGVRRQGARRRSLGPGELRAHAAGGGQEPYRKTMTAASASRAELVEEERRFPARTFPLFGTVLALVGCPAVLWTFPGGGPRGAGAAEH